MTDVMTSSSSPVLAPADHFAFIQDFDSEPHVSLQQTITDHIIRLILQPQDLDMTGRSRPRASASRTQPVEDPFSSFPSSLRDGIGDQRIPLHAHEVLASNLVSAKVLLKRRTLLTM